MAALDFPASPSNGQQFSGPGGVIWVYDLPGTKWVAATLTTGVYAPINSVPNINCADNTGFAVNQRAFVSGTALAAAAFGHDRWKAGGGGCTYTFAGHTGPANTITITAGTLQQVVEGANLVAGNYVLSWTGTAQGRVGAGSYAASPVSVAGITAGANTTIEFNTGTLGQVKFEAGTVATPWQALPYQQDLAKGKRFYRAYTNVLLPGYGGAGGTVLFDYFYEDMQGNPVPGILNTVYTNCSALTINLATFNHIRLTVTATAVGTAFATFDMLLSADI